MTMQMLMADERRAGHLEGREEGRVEGRIEGRVEGLLAAISGLMNTMNWPVEQAMEALNIPKDERAQYAALLRKEQETTL